MFVATTSCCTAAESVSSSAQLRGTAVGVGTGVDVGDAVGVGVGAAIAQEFIVLRSKFHSSKFLTN